MAPPEEEPDDGRVRWTQRVSLADLGARSVLEPHRALERMQDAAAYASFLGGYPPKRYRALGAGWFIREVLLSLDGPLHDDDLLTIETWVSDLRRFRSHREYRATAQGRTVFRAQVDWLFLERNQDTGRFKPRLVGSALKAAFPRIPDRVLGEDETLAWPDERTLRGLCQEDRGGLRAEASGEHRGFDEATGAGSSLLLRAKARTVRPTDIDAQGHVNHVVYLRWLEDDARSAEGSRENVLAFVRMEYLADLGAEDVVRLEVRALAPGLYYEIFRGATRVFRAWMVRRPG